MCFSFHRAFPLIEAKGFCFVLFFLLSDGTISFLVSLLFAVSTSVLVNKWLVGN